MDELNFWLPYLVCPIDHTPLNITAEKQWSCPTCGFETETSEVKGRQISDFRAVNRPQTVTLQFQIPTAPLDRYQLVKERFYGVSQDFEAISDADFRKRFGTKLDRGMQFYSQKLWQTVGADARILDLGCGNGGNRRYLQSLGFQHILTLDWNAVGADLLADAHRLPLTDNVFDMVISTAVFEHLYNPFIAMSEISRVLKSGGHFLGGASFWEGWHGSSYFHLTPDGWNSLLTQTRFSLEDVWAGWGIIPAALTHVLTPGHLRSVGYGLQRVVDGVYRLAMGESGVRKLHLRASGAYLVYATVHK